MTLTSGPRFMRHLRTSESVAAFIAACKSEPMGVVQSTGLPDAATIPTRVVYDFHGTPVVICEPTRGFYDVYEVPRRDVGTLCTECGAAVAIGAQAEERQDEKRCGMCQSKIDP